MSKYRYKGFLLAELVISMSVLTVILACMALGMRTFVNFNRYQLARQECISAAQAQLDSIAATGKPISDEDSKRLWPRITIKIEQADGAGQWEGLKLIKVKAIVKNMRKKDIMVETARYFAMQKEGQQ
jgi:type II secretory pathway pseudopilin PulG